MTMTTYQVQFMMTITMTALLTRYRYRMRRVNFVDDYNDNDDDCSPGT